LKRDSLVAMRKKWNGVAGSYEDVIRRFPARHDDLRPFVFRYDADTPASSIAPPRSRARSRVHCHFNPLTPMRAPACTIAARRGTPLRQTWWLDPAFAIWRHHLAPHRMSPEELREGPMRARRAFYSWPSIAERALRGAPKWRSPVKVGIMLLANAIPGVRSRASRAPAGGTRAD